MADIADSGFVEIESRFFHKLFAAFATLAVLSLLIHFGGREVGSRLSMGGHTDSLALHEIVIGNDVIMAPANQIRYSEQRRDGIANRVDLYVLWPDMNGFTEANRAAFNSMDEGKSLLFLSLEQRTLSRDMSGRLDPIYRKMELGQKEPLAAGLVRQRLPETAGFVDEYLIVGPQTLGQVFVARCLDETKATGTLASCERDIHVGEDLVLMARFPAALLADWQSLDANLAEFVRKTVKTVPSDAAQE